MLKVSSKNILAMKIHKYFTDEININRVKVIDVLH